MRIGWLRVHYVAVYAVLGCVLPYLPVYAEAIGLSDSEIGWVMGSFGIAVLIAPVIWTNIADRFGRTRTFIAVCYGLGMATLALMTLGEGFWSLFVLHLAFALGYTALIPLLDGLTFHQIGEGGQPADESGERPAGNGRRRSYWTLRVWGSVGWMLPGFGLALLVLTAMDRGQVASLALVGGAGLALIGLLLSAALPKVEAGSIGDSTGGGAGTLAAWRALRQPVVAGFVAGIFLMFLSISIYYAFYPKWLGLVGVDAAWVGLITNIGVAIEIGFMAASGWLLGRFGVRGVMIMGAAAGALRLGLIAAVPEAWMAIGTQIFHGPIVLALYVMPPMWLNRHAELRFRHSMQGLYVALCFGVARIVGAAAGGYVSEWVGGDPLSGLRATFAFSALLSGAAVVVYLVWRDQSTADADGPPVVQPQTSA